MEEVPERVELPFLAEGRGPHHLLAPNARVGPALVLGHRSSSTFEF